MDGHNLNGAQTTGKELEESKSAIHGNVIGSKMALKYKFDIKSHSKAHCGHDDEHIGYDQLWILEFSL
jgi:hypothetical protein